MKPTPTLIAYGSLMSGLGLTGLAPLPVLDVIRVRLHGGRRGFGKLSQYGDRFAMVLEPILIGEPLRAEPIVATTPTGGGIDALALTIPMPELARVAQREGYRADALLALAHLGERTGHGLGAYLWTLLAGVDFDVAAYRRALADAIDYTSPHYVPHPVATDGEPAITFLPPGIEGSGRDDVVPIRLQTAETRLFTFAEVWSLKPNVSQLDYAAMCVLAEAHNLSLADVLGDLDDHRPLAERLLARLAPERAVEAERFRTTLGLTPETYAARFPTEPRRAALLGTPESNGAGRSR